MTFRPYDAERDHEAAHRIWRETGWTTDDDGAKILDAMLDCTRGWVADLSGDAECLVLTAPGTVRHLADDLPAAFVAAVTTSRVARKQGFARRLTAKAIAADVADGALVSALGMFEQGFYDTLGFGTGSYVHRVGFDPTTLKVDGTTRPPQRLVEDDFERIHAARSTRLRSHGACNLAPAGFTLADIREHAPNGFGLGYADGPDGALTHHLWFHPRGSVEDGPYWVKWMAWQTREQFMELAGLMKNLGDQVRLMYVRESNGIQWQDLVSKPFQQIIRTEDSKFATRTRTLAYWQMRMNDVPRCLAATRLPPGDALRFNARLTDPIERFLDEDQPWRGVGGDYVITLGAESSAEPGHEATLPTLTATVSAFTRMWLGVRPASALTYTDRIEGPATLIAALDERLRLPSPEPDWDY